MTKQCIIDKLLHSYIIWHYCVIVRLVTQAFQKQLLVIQLNITIFHIGIMQVLTTLVVPMFKIFKIFKLSYLQYNGLKSFCCYLMASACVVAICTTCMVMLRRVGMVFKIIEVGKVCCVYRPHS